MLALAKKTRGNFTELIQRMTDFDYEGEMMLLLKMFSAKLVPVSLF